MTDAIAGYRPISFLAKDGDFEWLARKKCPKCGTTTLTFGHQPREILRCTQCGGKFKILGRKIEDG